MEIYFNLLLALFFLYLFTSLRKNLLFRPVIFYGFTLFLYPIISNGLYVYDLVGLYPWHPSYHELDYIISIQISLVSLVPITFIPFFIKRQYSSLLSKGSLTNFFIVRLLFRIFMIVLFAYAIINVNQFLIVEYGDLDVFSFITLFDYIIFSILLFWQGFFPQEKFKKIDILFLVGYALIKVVSGGRMFLVVVILLLAINYMRRNGYKLSSWKLLVLGIPLGALALGSVVIIRERSTDFLLSFYSLSIEYVNASFSSLKVASIADQLSTNFGMLIDPVLSLIPSNFLPRDFFSYFRLVDGFGGVEEMAPIGGLYLPHQVFLICPSLFWQFLYFTIWAGFLIHIDRKVFSQNTILSGYKIAFYMGCQSLLLVFSVRHFYFVHIKTILIIGIIVFFYYFLFQFISVKIFKRSFHSSINIYDKDENTFTHST